MNASVLGGVHGPPWVGCRIKLPARPTGGGTVGHVLPTGAQHEIGRGGLRAVVTEVGATLRHLSVDGTDLIDGFGETEWAGGGRGQVLAPWPNRLRGGRYHWEGGTLQLPLSEPERGNAIHGLVRWQAWATVDAGREHVALRHRIHPRDGYPFLVELTLRFRAGGDGLTVGAEAVNLGASPCPFGLGFHPYLFLGPGGVDRLRLRLPAARRLTTDARGIPDGSAPTPGTAYDFRSGRAVGGLALDTAFTELARDRDGRAVVSLERADGDWPVRSLRLWMSREFTHVMVFSGDTLEPEHRRRALAVEPMTCPPNALASGEGVTVLEPGRPWAGEWGIVTGPAPV